jgi:vancomycin resistance protein YoaR
MSAGAFPNTRIGAEGDYLDRNNVVINVNAPSAIDEEGFTRAVILAMNQTQSRTGGGGSQLLL